MPNHGRLRCLVEDAAVRDRMRAHHRGARTDDRDVGTDLRRTAGRAPAEHSSEPADAQGDRCACCIVNRSRCCVTGGRCDRATPPARRRSCRHCCSPSTPSPAGLGPPDKGPQGPRGHEVQRVHEVRQVRESRRSGPCGPGRRLQRRLPSAQRAMAMAAAMLASTLADDRPKRGVPSATARPIFITQLARMPMAIAWRRRSSRPPAARPRRHRDRQRVDVGQPEHGAGDQQSAVAEHSGPRVDREEHQLEEHRHLQRRTDLQRVRRPRPAGSCRGLAPPPHRQRDRTDRERRDEVREQRRATAGSGRRPRSARAETASCRRRSRRPRAAARAPARGG